MDREKYMTEAELIVLGLAIGVGFVVVVAGLAWVSVEVFERIRIWWGRQ